MAILGTGVLIAAVGTRLSHSAWVLVAVCCVVGAVLGYLGVRFDRAIDQELLRLREQQLSSTGASPVLKEKENDHG
jgi:hypothetical protein